MGVKQNIKKNSTYFLRLSVTAWVDVFTRQNHRDAIIESLRYCICNKGLNVYAYCLMSNHLHLLANTNAPVELSDVIRDFKRHTAKIIRQQIEREPESRREWMTKIFEFAGDRSKDREGFKFWKSGNHAIEVFTPQFTWDKINYIHANPVIEGLVSRPEHWLYSSAGNYFQASELLLDEVICLTPLLKTLS